MIPIRHTFTAAEREASRQEHLTLAAYYQNLTRGHYKMLEAIAMMRERGDFASGAYDDFAVSHSYVSSLARRHLWAALDV